MLWQPFCSLVTRIVHRTWTMSIISILYCSDPNALYFTPNSICHVLCPHGQIMNIFLQPHISWALSTTLSTSRIMFPVFKSTKHCRIQLQKVGFCRVTNSLKLVLTTTLLYCTRSIWIKLSLRFQEVILCWLICDMKIPSRCGRTCKERIKLSGWWHLRTTLSDLIKCLAKIYIYSS